MYHETISLKVPGSSMPVDLIAYLPDVYEEIDPERKRRTVILCPGGAYAFLSDRESEPVALKLTAAGFNVFILKYHTAPEAHFPVPQLELAAAVKYVRDNADQYHVMHDKLIVMGFSAGGHLACSLATWFKENLFLPVSEDPYILRPDGLLLCYPVITGGEFTHTGSMRNLYNTGSRKVWESRSLENYVHEEMPPTFIWSTWEDDLVENSLLLAQALRESNINTELHIFPHGVHGLSLDTEEVFGPNTRKKLSYPEIQIWIDLAIRWIRNL